MSEKILVFLAICLASGGQILMKKGLIQLGTMSLNAVGVINFVHKIILSPVIICGFFIYGVSSVIWLMALSKVELSLAYPMLAGSYVVVAILAHFLFGEQLSFTRMIGLAIIAIGVIVLSRG